VRIDAGRLLLLLLWTMVMMLKMMMMMMMMMDVYMQGKATIDVLNAQKYTAMMCGLVTCKASVTELLVQRGQ